MSLRFQPPPEKDQNNSKKMWREDPENDPYMETILRDRRK
jgi:hypothetical protein